MNKYQAAAEALERQAIKYKALVDAAETLKEVGSLEQAMQEASKAAADAKKEREKQVAELEKINKQLKDVDGVAADVLKAAKADAAGILKDAEIRAAGLEKAAQDKSTKIITDAQIEANAITSSAQVKLSAAKAEMTKAQGAASAVQVEIAELSRERDSLMAIVGELKAKLGSL